MHDKHLESALSISAPWTASFRSAEAIRPPPRNRRFIIQLTVSAQNATSGANISAKFAGFSRISIACLRVSLVDRRTRAFKLGHAPLFDGVITQARADSVLSRLEAANAAGQSYSVATIHVVGGRAPS